MLVKNKMGEGYRSKMKNFLKKLTGIDKIEQMAIDAEQRMIKATEDLAEKLRHAEITRQEIVAAEAEKARLKEEEELAKLSPKELATQNKEPWVAVLDTHINQDNIRNGFFELDWNEYFVLQLKAAGYRGSTDEEIVDSWFSELCRNVGGEVGVDMERRGSGFVNKALRDDGKVEIS